MTGFGTKYLDDGFYLHHPVQSTLKKIQGLTNRYFLPGHLHKLALINSEYLACSKAI